MRRAAAARERERERERKKKNEMKEDVPTVKYSSSSLPGPTLNADNPSLESTNKFVARLACPSCPRMRVITSVALVRLSFGDAFSKPFHNVAGFSKVIERFKTARWLTGRNGHPLFIRCRCVRLQELRIILHLPAGKVVTELPQYQTGIVCVQH